MLDEGGVWRCPRGHDKDLEGVDAGGQCNVCRKELRPYGELRRSLVAGREFRGLQAPLPNLKQVRLDLGLSQQQLADLAGISREAVSMAERGLRNPGYTTRQKLLSVISPALARQRRLYVR